MRDIQKEIIKRFLAANLQVHPGVVDAVCESNDPSLIDAVIKNVPEGAFVALPCHIPGYRQERYTPPLSQMTPENAAKAAESDLSSANPAIAHADRLYEEYAASEPQPVPAPASFAVHESKPTIPSQFAAADGIEVLIGAANSEKTNADFNNFAEYFRDRYNKLSKILGPRGTHVVISALTERVTYRGKAVTVIGMVSEIRNTPKGHRVAVIEDSTSSISVLFFNPQASKQNANTGRETDYERERRRRELFEESERIVPDEVIMIKGTLSSEGTIIFADTMHRPDVPPQNTPNRSPVSETAVFISDVHVGSDTFLEDKWKIFSKWLSTSGAKYLIIAGDVVDGIGVYPDQDLELTIPNIYTQYETFANMLRELPSDIQIIISPGNHDAMRKAAPQPALSGKFIEHFPENVILVDNPALISIHGVRILIYHGDSIFDLISMIPGSTYNKPEELMKEMLKRRLVACTYGKGAPIYPSQKDRLVIDPLPDIFHTGHVHISGYMKYNNVICVNSGTWQAQTAYQKQMNIQPDPARAYVIDLHTLKCRLLDCMGDEPVFLDDLNC